MTVQLRLLIPVVALAALAGCAKEGDLVVAEGVGVTAIRTACPAVGVPDYTGDITTFRSPTSQTLADLDVTAAITNVRSTCDETGDNVVSTATFDVVATRRDAGPERTVVLPYFNVVMQAGTQVVAKKVGTVGLTFAAGSQRASTRGQATIQVARGAATLPEKNSTLLNTASSVSPATRCTSEMSLLRRDMRSPSRKVP